MNEQPTPKYRSDLTEKLLQEKDKEKRRELLDEEKETSEYRVAQEEHGVVRQKIAEEKKQQKDLAHEKEKEEYFKEIQVLKLNFESKIAETNRLIDRFFEGFTGDITEVSSPGSLVPLKEQIDALAELQPESRLTDGRDYINRASGILLQLRRLDADIKSDEASRVGVRADLEARILDVKSEITELKSHGIIKKMMAYPKIKERQEKIDELDVRVGAADMAIENAKRDANETASTIHDLEKKTFRLMEKEMSKRATGEINQAMKELWGRFDGDTFFSEDAMVAYVQQVVVPAFDEAIEEWKSNEEKGFHYQERVDEQIKMNVLAELKKYITTTTASSEQSARHLVMELPSQLRYVFNPLFSNLGYGTQHPLRDITTDLFTQYVIGEISSGAEHLKRKKKESRESGADYDPNYPVRTEIGDDYYLRYPRDFDALPYGINLSVSIGRLDWHGQLPDMSLWSVARTVPSLRQGFGGAMEKLDQGYRNAILEKSLVDKDGKFIRDLYYYPDPDGIKTLVLLVAADFENYRTTHANSVLDRLARRPDWPRLLDAAEKKYPELKRARPVLEQREGDEQKKSAAMAGCVDDLAKDLLESEADNESQSALAEQVLPNKQLVELLASRKNVSAKDVDLLKQIDELTSEHVVEDYGFGRLMRRTVLEKVRLSRPKENGSTTKDKDSAESMALLMISRKIVEAKNDAVAVSFLLSSSVTQRVVSSLPFGEKNGLSPTEMDDFLSSYNDPGVRKMISHPQMLDSFCTYFKGKETIEFYKALGTLYQNETWDFNVNIARLVGRNELSSERVIALAGPLTTTRGKVNFLAMPVALRDFAMAHAGLLLQTDEGLDFLKQLEREGGIDNLDVELDGAMGKNLLHASPYPRHEFGSAVVAMEMKDKIAPAFARGNVPMLTAENWKGLMTAFIGVTEGHLGWEARDVFGSSAEQVKKVFETGGARDLCLAEMRKLWNTYLEREKRDDVPASMIFINDFIRDAGGAGPLSQVESLSMFTDSYVNMLNNTGTAPRTKREIAAGLGSLEGRFARERWSNEEISDFYNVSRDIIGAAPSMFSSYCDLFEKLKPKDFKEFSQELFPLHRVLLSLSEKRGGNRVAHNSRDLTRMRGYVENVMDETGQLKPVGVQKKELTEQVLARFKAKFGIVKIPESLSQENMRALSDLSLYLANLSQRTAQKEDIIGFFLALAINDKWEDYRRGVEIDPAEYLVPEKAENIRLYLENRRKLDPITAENVGVASERMPEFMGLLQEESENAAIGNVQTVDVKLHNVITNLKGLEDPDLYPDILDRRRMQLLLEYGNKKVGATASKVYQSLMRSGKQVVLSEDESKIKEQIERALAESNIELTAENVKRCFQDGIKPLAVVANILHFAEEIGAEQEILELHDLVRPSDEVVAVFNKMGEGFKPTSGAVAISQDLEYLDNVVVKKSGNLSEEEIGLVRSYLTNVREKLAILENIYDQVGKKFASMKQGQTETKNELLRGKLEDIAKIITLPESQQMIVSTMTNNLPYIIENIRECLSCIRQGGNNDTNLTFGDSNKFYLSSRSEMSAKSISDELVFFEPITLSDGSKEMAFVLDRLYGTNTPAILLNHIEAVYKKYIGIKQKFPDAKISIFISDAATQASSLPAKLLTERLREKLGGKFSVDDTSQIEVDVVESAAGDSYVEFGGGARSAGSRLVNGMIVRG